MLRFRILRWQNEKLVYRIAKQRTKERHEVVVVICMRNEKGEGIRP